MKYVGKFKCKDSESDNKPEEGIVCALWIDVKKKEEENVGRVKFTPGINI